MITVLHCTASDLAKWLSGQLLRHGGQKWFENHVCGIVHEKDEWRIKEGHWKQLEDMDLAGLLNVLSANFRFLKARNAIKKDDWELLLDMREARNRCEGHWPLKGLASDEVKAHLESISRFSVRFGGGKNLTEQVASLRSKLHSLATSVESQIFVSEQSQSSMVPAVQVEETRRLKEFFAGHQLTPSQAITVDALQKFLDDPDSQCFVINGYAGTGKTFLIGGLVRYLHHSNRKPEMMAPTGRAAHVIRERHQVDASTIHRHIYALNTLKEFRELDESGDVTYKFYFDLKNNDMEHDTVFIVDEASMISDMYSEAEFMHFGSGRLLSDLLQYINFDANDYRKKLILVGDDAQLPPFGMGSIKIPPALDESYLREKRWIRTTSSTLIDVVRQAGSSLIVKNATRMRDLLRQGRFASFDFVADDDQVREVSPDALVDTFVRERISSLTPDMVIIAYTNPLTRTYNAAVRSRLFPGVSSLTRGDQIIVVRNNYRHERPLMNGQMGQVIEVDGETEVRTVHLNIGKGKEMDGRQNVTILLKFRMATLRFSDDREGYFEIPCKISEDCLLNAERDLPSEYSKALYVDFRNRHPHLKPSQPEFKEVLKADPYFNVVMLKFGYAITCHKAQGGEWPTVFVDFSGRDKLDAESLRWSYTALTRARERVVATNALHRSILKSTMSSTIVVMPHSAPLQSATSDVIDGRPSDSPNAEPKTTSEVIRFLIADVSPPGWEIDSLRSLQWEEQFILMSEGRHVPVSVYHNGKQKISNVKVTATRGQDQFDGEVAAILTKLKGKSVSLASSTDPGEHIDGIHQDFSEALKGQLRTAGIRLVGLRSNTIYHLTARLEWKGAETAVNYYIDGMGKSTRFLPQPGCPPDLCDLLKIIHA
jgi:hypothetical protein